MLKTMSWCFKFDNDNVYIMPVWVKLSRLPLDCWNLRALAKIASKIGNPISTYKFMSNKERLSYARALGEVDASKDFVQSVEMTLPRAKIDFNK